MQWKTWVQSYTETIWRIESQSWGDACHVCEGGALLKNNRVRWQHWRHIHPVAHYLAHIKNPCESIEEACNSYSDSIELILLSAHPSLLCQSLWEIKCLKCTTTSEPLYSGFTWTESIPLLIAQQIYIYKHE